MSPTPTSQLTGTLLAKKNCTWTCATMGEHRHSVGRFRHGPDALRAESGDTLGGSTYGQNAVTVSQVTGGAVKLEPRFSLTRSMVRDYVAGGRGGSISIDTAVTANTTRRTGTYIGPHSVFVNAYFWRAASSSACSCEKQTKLAHAEFDVCDPGKYLQAGTKFMRWSADLLYRAAERRGGGGAGSSVIAMLLTRDTEGVTRTAVEAGHLYLDASTSSTVVASFSSGHSFTVLATADGAGWKAPDGATRKNWHRAKGASTTGYVMGRTLQ